MLKQFVCVGVFIGSILLAPLAFAENESADEREGKIKAACLYYLAKFVEWPAWVFQNSETPLRLCILGKDPLNAFVISTMDGKTVGNRKIEIAFRSQGANDQHDPCHFVYLGEMPQGARTEVLKRFANRPVLTVSGAEDITSRGGIVYLFRKESKLGIRINLEASHASGLKVSSELLQIAEVIS